VTITELIKPRRDCETHLWERPTLMDFLEMMNFLFGVKVKYLDGSIVRSGNYELIVRCDGD